MNDTAVWTAVIDERRTLADELDGLDAETWDRASRCDGWRVRDVVGHLVWLAERSRPQLLVDGTRTPLRPNVAVDRFAKEYGASDPADLASRLRAAAAGRGRGPFLPPASVLGEVRTHRADLAAAAGLAPRPADDRLRAVLKLYRRLWFAFGLSRRVRTVRFEPDGAGWSVGPHDGLAITGPPDEVLLAIAGRAADVRGAGVALLRR